MRPDEPVIIRPRVYLASLQAARGLAALSVLLFHLTGLFHLRLGIDLGFARKLFRPGFLGADFFFVLSGFIIYYMHRDDIGKPAVARSFLTRRLTRLYPVFLSVCLIKLVLALVLGEQLTVGGVVTSLLLLPQTVPPLLDVAWTLSFEVCFYALFLLLILHGRRLWWVFVAHAALLIATNLPGIPKLRFPWSFVLDPQFLEFYGGCIACHFAFCRTWRKREVLGLLFVGVAMTVLGWTWFTGKLGPEFLAGRLRQGVFWGIAFSIVVFSMAALGARLDRFVPRPLKFIGDASYSVYLVHGGVINLLLVVIKHRVPGYADHGALLAVAVGLGALGAGCVYHVLAEKPILKACRKWFPEQAPAQNAVSRSDAGN